jgi:dynein heavy chain
VTEWETAEDVNERAHQGCFITGLYLEGASWEVHKHCLTRQKPKVLIQELPVMKVIPIESHKLKLQVKKKLLIKRKLSLVFFRILFDVQYM